MGSTSYDIFLSHNSRDKATVERIAVQLKRDGFTPWLDVWDLPAGGDWQDGIELGLRHSRGCAVFLGPHGFGDWQVQEMKVASSMAAHDPAFRYFLMLLPGAPDPLDAATLPAFINLRGRVNLREGFESPRQFQRLSNAILGIAMGPSVPIEPELAESPYRGLEAFDANHVEFFFGRDAEIRRLLDKLRDAPFLAVIGPSGSGKSSLVLAGLIPALRNGRLEGSTDWPLITMVPGAHPLESLAVALDPLDAERSRNRLLEELRGSSLALRLEIGALLRDRPRDAKLVLIVDQFEEIFTLCRDEDERDTFLGLLLAAAHPDGRGIVIITMRADFYPRVTEYPALAEQVESHQLLVGALTKEGLTAAIEQPAFLKGLQFEPGLVSTILADVGGDAGALPLLQYALDELWKRQHGGLLTLEGYRASGGVGDAIATRANAVFEQLTPDQQAVARRVLLRLTQPGESTEDTRRRAELDELVTRPAERPAIEAAVNALVAARLLTASRDEASGAAQVDVAHEALIRAWPRLRQWLDEDRQGLLVHRRLTEAAQGWERTAREPDLLYRGSRLTEAVALATLQPDALNELEREFLAESAALREQERCAVEEHRLSQVRLRRRVLIGLAVFSLLALSLAALAGWQWRESERQTIVAQEQRDAAQAAGLEAESQGRIALSRQLAAQALNERTGGLDRRLLLAVEANQRNPGSADARGSLLTLLESSPTIETFLRSADTNQAGPLAFTTDDRTLVVETWNGRVALWNTQTRQPKGSDYTTQRDIWFWPFAVSSDGKTLAAANFVDDDLGGGEQLITLFDIASFSVIGELTVPPMQEGYIHSLAFSPDGDLLAAGRGPGGLAGTPGALVGDIILWDVATGEQLAAPIKAHGSAVRSVAFSPDGKTLTSGGSDGWVTLWEVMTLEQIERLALAPNNIVDVVAISPDGKRLAAAGGDGALVVWDLVDGLSTRQRRADQPGYIFSLAFSADSHTLATSGTDGVIRLWDMRDDPLTAETLRGQGASIQAVAFSSIGQTLASGAVDGTVVLWNLDQQSHLGQTVSGVSDRVSPGGHFVAARRGPAVEVIDAATGELVSNLDVTVTDDPYFQEHNYSSLHFSPAGTRLATIPVSGPISVWNSVTGQRLGELDTGDDKVTAVAFSHDETTVATGASDGSVQLWNGTTFAPRGPTRGEHRSVVSGLVFSADGRTLMSSSYDAEVHVWDVPTRARMSRLFTVTGLTSVTMSPDDKLIVATGEDGLIYVWERASLESAAETMSGEGGKLAVAAFSRDGRTLATAGVDGNIILWDLTTRSPIGEPLTFGSGWISDLAFSVDGNTILVIGENERSEAFTISVETWMHKACEIANRNLTRREWAQFLGAEPYHETCPDFRGSKSSPLEAASSTPSRPGSE
jgi:WD40 repeat protein